MTTFIYFILFSVAFYYAFKFGMRLLLPYAMRKLTERMMSKAQQSHQYNTGGQNPFSGGNPFESFQQSKGTRNPKGKIQVDYMPPKEDARKGTATAGEFVDFEEIK